MINPRELFTSVEDVWLVWAASALALVVLVRRRPRRRGGLRRLLGSEDGAAYSLAYVLTFPFYLLLVCLVIQSTLILVVKMGTVYASYAATRAAVVWVPADPSLADAKVQLAAVQAIAPFASSDPHHAAGAGVSAAPSTAASRFDDAYGRFATRRVSSRYLIAKYKFAARATEARVDPMPEAPEGDVTVRVAYEMPLLIPGAGRILGHRAPWPSARFWTRRVESSATLTGEVPAGPDANLGIDYVSD